MPSSDKEIVSNDAISLSLRGCRRQPKQSMPGNECHVYLMTNRDHTVIYTGSTNNLERRVRQHKNKSKIGFTARYNISKLVYFEQFPSISQARARERQIKAGSRQRKMELINAFNAGWDDLLAEIASSLRSSQ